MNNNTKLLLVGNINNYCLETSYANAAKALGYEVIQFDPRKETEKYVKFGKPGKKMQNFLPVEAWVRKMNRELIIFVKENNPGCLIFIWEFQNFLWNLNYHKIDTAAM